MTENEVECVINNLKGKFSAGYDEIPEYLVKQCERLTLNAYLYHLFHIGTFLEKFKMARVKPLFKKDIHKVQNYRAILVSSVFSKILEKVVYDRLTMLLNKYNILT